MAIQRKTKKAAPRQETGRRTRKAAPERQAKKPVRKSKIEEAAAETQASLLALSIVTSITGKKIAVSDATYTVDGKVEILKSQVVAVVGKTIYYRVSKILGEIASTAIVKGQTCVVLEDESKIVIFDPTSVSVIASYGPDSDGEEDGDDEYNGDELDESESDDDDDGDEDGDDGDEDEDDGEEEDEPAPKSRKGKKPVAKKQAGKKRRQAEEDEDDEGDDDGEDEDGDDGDGDDDDEDFSF